MSKASLASCATMAAVTALSISASAAPFKVFMISSLAPDHLAMSAAARTALPQMGQMNDFTVDATTDPSLINDANLAQYQVFLQMHLAPFEIKAEQRGALERFVQQGKGWVGVHAAGLVIPSEYTARGLLAWDFYANLIGGASYVTHPALQMGTIVLEDRTHPATKNMPASFQILDEWYEWSKNPRPAVRVLGKADEQTYRQVRSMGDHPMIWACETYQRALYISTGHDASDWNNASYKILIRDALLWASGTVAPAGDAGIDAPGADGSGGDASSARDASFDAPLPTDARAANDGSGGGAGAAGAMSDGAAGSAVDAEGAGGALSGSGGGTGGGGQPTAGAAGSGGQATASTSATGSGGGSSVGAGGASNAGPAGSSEGCSCRLVGSSRSAPASGGAAPLRSLLFMLVGLALTARRWRAH